MSYFQQIQRLADRYTSDAAFRAEMARDPEGTTRRLVVERDGATRRTLLGVSDVQL